MPGRQCCVPWCRGNDIMVAVWKEAIPELKKWPCQFIREDIDEKVKSHFSDNPDYICLRHLRAYKHGMENGIFELHDIHTCPVITDIITGAFLYHVYPFALPLPRHTTLTQAHHLPRRVLLWSFQIRNKPDRLFLGLNHRKPDKLLRLDESLLKI